MSTGLAPAQRLALSSHLVADLVVLTLLVSEAAHISASHQRVALLASGTEADGNVVLHLALGPSATRGLPAGILALLVAASLVKGTVLVGLALIWREKKSKAFA